MDYIVQIASGGTINTSDFMTIGLGIQVILMYITSTISEFAVFVLPMTGIYEVRR
jgi:hypothetical protein